MGVKSLFLYYFKKKNPPFAIFCLEEIYIFEARRSKSTFTASVSMVNAECAENVELIQWCCKCWCVIQPTHTHTRARKQNPSIGLKAEASVAQ